MKSKILQTIETHRLIESGDTVVIGLSGGADSIYLLHRLHELKEILNIDLVTAHVNHGVRGEEALRDEEFSKMVSQSLGIPHFSKDVDMNGYAAEHKISAEEAGRILRYDFFREVASNYNSVKIAVAHNRDDQAETVLMRVLRGTGVDGLAGIPYVNGNVIRPILDISRQEIEDYLHGNDIEYVDDHTNFETDYMRNVIRLELIPKLEEVYNPNIMSSLVNLSQFAREDVDYMNGEVERVYRDLVISGKGHLKISIDELNLLHQTIQKRIIRKMLTVLLGTIEGIYSVHVDEILGLAKNQTGKVIDNIKGLKISNSYGELIFEENLDIEPKDYEFTLEMGINTLEYDLCIELSRVESLGVGSKSIAYFDGDKCNGPIKVRNRRNGDRIVPIGMSGSKKLKDVFIDEKIPRDLRDELPIFLDDEKIIWIGGVRQSELTKVDENTVNIIKIEIKGGHYE